MAKYATMQNKPFLTDEELETFLDDNLENTLCNFTIVGDTDAEDDYTLERL